MVSPASDAIVGGDPDLLAALTGLSAGDKEVLILWAWEGLEPREIAVVLDISVNAATIRLHRAKQRLGTGRDRRKSSSACGDSAVGHPREHE